MAKPLIILDSGHNEYVAGKQAPDGSMKEWEFNNAMQYLLKPRLEQLGFEVYLTNPNPEKKNEIGLSKRCSLANAYWKKVGKPKCLFVSLHANAHLNKFTDARGVETYAYSSTSSGYGAAKMVNDAIFADIRKIDSAFKNRGRKTANFAVIRNTSMPAILIEYAFYSNLADLKLLKNNRKDFAEATLKGLCQYFGVKYVAPQTAAPQPKPQPETKPVTGKTLYYKTLVSSMTVKANVDALVAKLKAKGFKTNLNYVTVNGVKYTRVYTGSFTVKANADRELEKLKKAGFTDATIIKEYI